MKKEILIYFAILIITAPLMHGGKLIDNFFKALENPQKFGHTLVYGGLIYLVLLIIRFIISEIIRVGKKAFVKNSNK